jgi:hypothetical protein
VGDKEEEEDMTLLTPKVKRAGSLSNHPNFNKKVPRLNVVDGKVQINSDDPEQRKWFEEFKK